MTPKFLLRFPDNPALEYAYTIDELRVGYREGKFKSNCRVRQEHTNDAVSLEALMATGSEDVAAVSVKPGSFSDTIEVAHVERSGVAVALSAFGVLELIASPIAGYLWGQQNGHFGSIVFFSGLIGGLLMLGFAKIIDLLNEAAQRLRTIEKAALQMSRSRKNA